MDKLEIYNEIANIAKDMCEKVNSCLYFPDGTPRMITNRPLADALSEYGLKLCSIAEKIEKDLNIKE